MVVEARATLSDIHEKCNALFDLHFVIQQIQNYSSAAVIASAPCESDLDEAQIFEF